MTQPNKPRGLATLALLKTRFDAGQDHLGLLEPFVEDVLPILDSGNGFTVANCKAKVEEEHGLVIPQDALASVLGRLVRLGKVRRDGGRYWTTEATRSRTPLQAEKAASQHEFDSLANAFQKYAAQNGQPIGSPEDALAILVGFLIDNDVVLVLDELHDTTAISHGAISARTARLTASFIQQKCIPDPAYSASLDRLLRGIILQNALLLRNIATASERLSDVTVFFDTGFLFSLVGAKGPAAAIAAKESVALVREVGAKLSVFGRTLDEMRRILHVYERHLATAEGRLSLYATDLTYHFVTTQATPADVRQLASLLELRVREAGFVFRDFPQRRPEFTLDEAALAHVLTNPAQGGNESRVQHDVDCVAAILQFRQGGSPSSIERCKAVFATTSGLVLRTVNDWFREQGGKGVSPVIHQLALSNIAWLKKPAAAGSLQLHELAALCEAALRPARGVWDAFKKNLISLRDKGEITTDEAVAVAASGLAVSLLSEIPDISGADAESLGEVVERVRDEYRRDADTKIARHKQETDAQLAQREHEFSEAIAKESERAEAAERAHRALEARVATRVTQVSRLIANVSFWIGVVVAGGAIVLGLPGVFDAIPTAVRAVAWIVVALAGGFQGWAALTGGGLFAARDRIQKKIAPVVEKVILATYDAKWDQANTNITQG